MRNLKAINVLAVNSPQFNKESTFRVYWLVVSFCILFQKYILRQGFRLSLALNFFLNFHKIPPSCSYKKCLVVCCLEVKENHRIGIKCSIVSWINMVPVDKIVKCCSKGHTYALELCKTPPISICYSSLWWMNAK